MNEEKKKVIVSFFRQIMQVYDFEIMIDINKNLENVFRLNDIQKGNLGGIEQEEFSTLADISEGDGAGGVVHLGHLLAAGFALAVGR